MGYTREAKDDGKKEPVLTWIKRILLGLIAVFVLLQAVPYGRDHRNPPVTLEPKWDSPKTRELAVRACYDCHSNETRWPWYSNIAPLSWIIQNDVEEGRRHLNFSEWDRPQRHADDTISEVNEGSMPPGNYVMFHSEAALTQEERDQLIIGLDNTPTPPKE